jgi:hypothetical protein
MCKKSLLFLLLMAMFAPWAANAQTTVEIGDGTSAGYYNPIGTYYNYSITEQLYTADEIGMSGSISSVSFYWAFNEEKNFNITMYMANVDAENLSTGISLAEADEVFTGTLSVPATAGWVTITLDTPFAYDGTSNLLIGFNKTGGSTWFSGNTWQYTSTSETGYMARYTQNDNTVYTTSTVPGSTSYSRPNIQMVITAGSGPVCEKPATMEASNVTTNSATLTWTGGSGTYNVEYMGGTVTEWTSYLTNTTATSANLSGLTPGTAYQYRVQSVCGSDVSGWKSVSFMTMFGIPLVEEFGTSIPTGWSQYTGLLENVMAGTAELTATTYAWNFGENNGVFDNHARVNIYGTGCAKWLVLPTLAMENNVELTFEVALTAYSGTGAPATTGTDDKFVVLANVGRGWTILRQWDNAGSEYVYNDLNTTPITVSLNLSSYAGQNVTVAFYGESTVSNADNNLHIDNVSIDYIPACPKPTGLAVNYENGTTATVTWEGNAAGYQLDVNGTTYTTNNTTYSLTGLELATTYEVKVRANCGSDGYSEWTNAVSFRTDNCLPENMCQISLALVDSYGDGWNGAAIEVYDFDTITEDLTLLNTFTISSGSSADYTLNVCDGRYLVFFWSAGGYDSECSYAVYDNLGDPIFSGSDAMDDYELFFMNCNSTCRTPIEFAASEIGGHSVMLNWTEQGEATSWTLAYMSENDTVVSYVENITTKPYMLEGLTPLTKYYAMVTANCEDQYKWSDVISWTTDAACPKPHITVNAAPTSAEVSWTGFADEYTFEWAQVPTAESKDALWLQYDDDTYVGGIGNSSANTWTWGVMYPADMLLGNGLLSKVSIYETAGYNTEDITINIYSGGDDAPGELVYTETVTPEAADAFHEITLSEVVTVDPTQNLWITLTEYGTYVMSYCQNGDNANNDWVYSGSAWAHIGDLASSLAGDTWMIRAYVEPSFDPDELDWQVVTGATSPVTLSPLEPETQYVVRIKALCGGEDGESEWATVSFFTPALCTVPFDLESEVEATSATLSWTGYQESYNVRYRRTPYVATTYFSENFDEGLPTTWTTIDNDTTTVGNWIALSEINSVYTSYTSPLTGWAHSGADAVASASFVNGIGAVATDNYLVTPQVTFNGKLRFYATSEYEDPDTYEVLLSTTGNSISDFNVTLQAMGPATYNAWDEVIIDLSDYAGQQGYIAIHHVATDKYWLVIDDFGMYDLVYEDWTNTTATENTLALTGLTPEAEYEWQVQGVNCDGNNGTTEWSEIVKFTTPELTTLTQTIALVAGKNWISFNVETNLDDLKAALVEAVPGTAIKIQGKSAATTYNPSTGKWRGQLSALDLTQMCKVEVTAACEITLVGMPIDPAAYPITINANAATWIAFPLNESMTVANAFNGFAKNGDQVKAKVGSTTYNETTGKWRGSLSSLQPGMGYVYISNWSEPRTLVFSTGAKTVQRNLLPTTTLNDLKKKVITNTNDLEIVAPQAPRMSAKDILLNERKGTLLNLIINKK